MMKRANLFLIVGCLLSTGKPISAQEVDPFTGNFSYSAPLMTVPSPDGAGVPISIGYGAGIGVNQSSGEIGLGWGINAGGAISRRVSGIPDDWIGTTSTVAHAASKSFKQHWGVLHFRDCASCGGVFDFYSSSWRTDTAQFSFPDYDSYSVSGPGLGGAIMPRLFEYKNIDNTGSGNYTAFNITFSGYSKKAQFMFVGDYAGNLVSRQYTATPVTSATPLNLPTTSVSTTCDPGGYGSQTTPYIGCNNVGFDLSTNRPATAKFVEYFTNTEINGGSGVPGFINFQPGHARSALTYDMDAIGGFRITDESGYMYHYSLPVYINWSVNGTYPLNNDYTIPSYNLSTTTSVNNYIIQDNNKESSPVVEYKQDKKYAYNWLLVAVTGPDYVDANNNGMADAFDKGYWVSYDWQLWTRNFVKRTPDFGFQYAFNGGENESTADYAFDNTKKINGRAGNFSVYEQELYYLNKIKTSSHTAIFVRDIRNDNHGSDNLDRTRNIKTNMGLSGGTTLTNWYGSIYDNGGPGANYSNTTSTYTVTLTPGNADKVNLTFTSLALANDAGDYIKVYNGPGTGSPLIGTYTYTNTPSPITSSGTSITIQFVTNATNAGAGFQIDYKPVWNNGRAKVMPQLKLSKVFLFRNEEFANLPAPTSITSSNVLFDLTQTQAGAANIYSGAWYTANQTAIHNNMLQSAEFTQEYTLARKFHNNVYSFSPVQNLTRPKDVMSNYALASGQNDNSGKLALMEINTYGLAHAKTSPSTIFDYNKSIAADNPDYDPRKVDYWGFYKSDIDVTVGDGFSSYTTPPTGNPLTGSADYTDAWSMRKITAPLGGTIEPEYESDRYEKVLSENGGFKGASRMYAIKTATAQATAMGTGWDYTPEDNAVEFSGYAGGTPSGMIEHAFIPFRSASMACLDTANRMFCMTNTYSSINTTNITAMDSYLSGTLGINNYSLQCAGNTSPNCYNFCVPSGLIYTGNGYINFELPTSTTVYGGGIRVKNLIAKNSTIDTYTTQYTYSEGITPNEPDRFDKAEQRKDIDRDVTYWKTARGFDGDHHKMAPEVGYTKVSVKNLGQVNEARGSTDYTFITSDAGIDNFKVNKAYKWVNLCTSYVERNRIIEVSDKFTSLWGKVKEVQQTDMNNNVLSLTRNTYFNPSQGAIVENNCFLVSENFGCPLSHRNICILRNYPVALQKQEVYKDNMTMTTEYLKFDNITGEPISVLTTAPNSTTVANFSTKAFRISTYSLTGMGPKSVNPSDKNILSALAETQTTKDSLLALSTGNFTSHSASTFKKDLVIRKYDGANNKYAHTLVNNAYWAAEKSYTWTGPLDNFGLFNKSLYVAFDHTQANINSNWRFGSENILRDERGHVLETRGFNNRFSAARYGYKNQMQIARAGNVNFTSFVYTGFEDTINAKTNADPKWYFGGEVQMNGGIWTATTGTVTPHTGNYMVKVQQNTNGPIYTAKYTSGQTTADSLQRARTYRASVWVQASSPASAQLVVQLDGSTNTTVTVRRDAASGVQVGDWVLLTADIYVPYNYVSSGGTYGLNDLRVYVYNPSGSGADAYFDDLRLHPVDASLSATVYDTKTGRLMAELDNNNFATIYKYDATGRVSELWQELEGAGLKRIKKYSYNFARGLQ